MITQEAWASYTAACVLIILAPGPDNVLAISRGLSQGRGAAFVSAIGAGCGLTVHAIAAVLGFAVLVQTSAIAFVIVKVVGAAYLIWLGVKALRNKDLISFTPQSRKPLSSVFMTGFLTNVLNPKPVIFILAFVPQFVSADCGSVVGQTLVLGVWFALLAVFVFGSLGVFASSLARYLEKHPRTIVGLNVGAGVSFIGAGLSITLLERL